MAAILRDRINDLLTANADLEREVARLRYADAGNKSGADENQMQVNNQVQKQIRCMQVKLALCLCRSSMTLNAH